MGQLTFPNNAYLAAFVSAFLTTLLVLPLWRVWCERVGLVDDPGHRKIHSTPMPLAGGLAVLTGLLLPLSPPSAVLKFNGSSIASEAAHLRLEQARAATRRHCRRRDRHGLLGLLDDKHELKPLTKFTGQFLIALLVAAAGVRITLFVPNVVFSYAVTILWLLTVINAFNFMDNMNGLCAGLGAIGAGLFAIVAACTANISSACSPS